MSQFKPYMVSCTCGTAVTANLADILHGNRSEVNRLKILDRTFHQVQCPSCDKIFTVEKDFIYIDTAKKLLVRILPSETVSYQNKVVPDIREVLLTLGTDVSLPDGKDYTVRIACGLEELREKLVLSDHDLDDKVIEALKSLAFLKLETRQLPGEGQTKMWLDSITDQGIVFRSYQENAKHYHEIVLVKDLLRAIQAQMGMQLAMESLSVNEFWISINSDRNQTEAMKSLIEFAALCPAGPIDINSPRFRRMINFLPRGTRLSDTSKANLLKVCEYVEKNYPKDSQRTIEILFEIRFDTDLENQWFDNYPNEIRKLWLLLKDLPDSNVEGNIMLSEILIDDKKGGGLYYIGTGKVYLGEYSLSTASYDDIVRHEIGHAVMDDRKTLVEPWLGSKLGWKMFPGDDAGIKEWIDKMGGLGSIADADKKEVIAYIKALLTDPASPPAGYDGWQPDSTVPSPAIKFALKPYLLNTAPIKAVLQCTDFAARTGKWFDYYGSWYVHNNKAFSLNYYYNQPMMIESSALGFITSGILPISYAAMSWFEYFAELYNAYYKPGYGTGLTFPADINNWMESNIGKSEAGGGARLMSAKDYEAIKTGNLGSKALPF